MTGLSRAFFVSLNSNMVYVIGGSLREAEEFIRRRKLSNCLAIDDSEPLRDLEAPEVIITGTFIARRDVQSLYDVFRATYAMRRYMS